MINFNRRTEATENFQTLLFRALLMKTRKEIKAHVCTKMKENSTTYIQILQETSLKLSKSLPKPYD